jgi:hypothetical protein
MIEVIFWKVEKNGFGVLTGRETWIGLLLV